MIAPSLRLQAGVFLAIALLLGGLRAVWTLERCDGELIAPLDDAYIYLQYAQRATEGEPLRYQPGAEPTRGSTSFVFPLLLAPGVALLPREHTFWLSWAIGIVTLAASALAVARLLARIADPTASWIGGLLTVLSGRFVWGALCGLEIGPYALLLTAAVAMVATYAATPRGDPRARRRFAMLAVLLATIGFARPEGIALAGVIAAGVALLERAPHARRVRAALVLGPAFCAAASMAVNWIARGASGTNTLDAKAFWTGWPPDQMWSHVRGFPVVFARVVRAVFNDGSSVSWGGPTPYLLEALMWGGIGVAVAAACVRGPFRGVVRIGICALGAALLTGLIPLVYGGHYFRYQMPYIPLATALAVWGWQRLARRLGPRTPRIVAAAALVLLLPETIRYVDVGSRNAKDILDHQVSGGRWIRDNLPADAIVGINDAGALAYFGDRPVVDLVGLVTRGSTRAFRAGEGALFEWLESLPDDRRPTHFVIFPMWFPHLSQTSLLGEVLREVMLEDITISGGPLKTFRVADWSRVDTEDRLLARDDLLRERGLEVVDAVDVGDLVSEGEHGYRPFPSWRSVLRELPIGARTVIDGGRRTRGGERFELACRPFTPAVLVLRTVAFRPLALRVHVDGTPVGELAAATAAQRFSEVVLELPASALGSARVEVEVHNDDPSIRYAAYHYWLLQ